MGKSLAMFSSYVTLPEGIYFGRPQVKNPNETKNKTRLGTFTRRLASQRKNAVEIAPELGMKLEVRKLWWLALSV